MVYSLPGSPVHVISQARILEWVAITFSRTPSQPSDWTSISCIARELSLPLSHQKRPYEVIDLFVNLITVIISHIIIKIYIFHLKENDDVNYILIKLGGKKYKWLGYKEQWKVPWKTLCSNYHCALIINNQHFYHPFVLNNAFIHLQALLIFPTAARKQCTWGKKCNELKSVSQYWIL